MLKLREPAVTVKERLRGGVSPFGEGDQCRAAVGRMRFAGHEPGGHQAATGRTVEYVSHEFYRIADGLIAEEWICSDMSTLLRQLG